MANNFSRFVDKVHQAPLFLQSFLLTRMFFSKVNYAKTTGIKITKVSNQEVIVTLANKKKVQNHIGGIHAVAAALIAESATGIVFGLNVPDKCIPLLKSMTMRYQRRMQGALTAKATMTDRQISQINSDEKGDMLIPVLINDESEQPPIECEMVWAWVSKKR
ncbi:MAG: acyl-coenzyme A thioesterase PaaI-like protein [Alteromonadaceae bacterium]|jgi:acyl-coenzyme A thioesterase PaaI-like protein|tara:strand:- start:257 stop:742 length:486 start_codon:yes stop_codon:yes gene_type:complete